jgi:hypothetical protein
MNYNKNAIEKYCKIPPPPPRLKIVLSFQQIFFCRKFGPVTDTVLFTSCRKLEPNTKFLYFSAIRVETKMSFTIYQHAKVPSKLSRRHNYKLTRDYDSFYLHAKLKSENEIQVFCRQKFDLIYRNSICFGTSKRARNSNPSQSGEEKKDRNSILNHFVEDKNELFCRREKHSELCNFVLNQSAEDKMLRIPF